MQTTMMSQRTSRVAMASRSRATTVVVRAANIVETAKAKGYTSFVAAVEKAGLTEALSAGPFTVFVPTNEAFAAYDSKDPHTKGDIKLTDTLTYHVVKGKTQGRHLENFANIRTIADERFAALSVNIRAKKGSLLIGSPAQGTQGLAGLPLGGWVIEKDIACDNGIIHVVDGVFRPQELLPANNGSGSAGASAAW